jgi:hypothetical protein
MIIFEENHFINKSLSDLKSQLFGYINKICSTKNMLIFSYIFIKESYNNL